MVKKFDAKTVFFVGLICSASGFLSPPLALAIGLVFGLIFTHPFIGDSRSLAKFLLQASVVALGFGMNLREVLRAGRSGFFYTAVLRQNSMRTENSAIPCRDGCLIQVIPSPSDANLSRGTRAVYLYI